MQKDEMKDNVRELKSNRKIINDTVRDLLVAGAAVLNRTVQFPVLKEIAMEGPLTKWELMRNLDNSDYDWKKAKDYLCLDFPDDFSDGGAKLVIITAIVAKIAQKGLCITKNVAGRDCFAIPVEGKENPFSD